MVLFMIIAVPLWANLTYDPITDIIYSEPQLPDINQADYFYLFRDCVVIEANIKLCNKGNYPSKNDALNQLSIYLKRIGTPTALRLMSDLKKNKFFYPDGSVMRHIWY